MRMRVLTTKLRVDNDIETRVFLESLNFEIEMRVSQKFGVLAGTSPYQLDGNLMTFLLLSSRLAGSCPKRETEKILSLEDGVNLHRLLIVIALLLTIFMSYK